jgi:hypothetical protein
MNKAFYSLIPFLILQACNSEKKTPTIKLIAVPASNVSAQPYLTNAPEGQPLMSWVEENEDLYTLKFSTLDNELWSTPKTIVSDTNWFANWADYPMVAQNGDHMIAHYLSPNGEGVYAYDIKIVQSRDKGATWNTPWTLHDDGKQAEHGFVTLLPYNDGFFATWLDGRNTTMEGHMEHMGAMTVRAATISTDGTKTEEKELDNRVCDCCQTHAAITEHGPVAIFRDRSEEEIRDIAISQLKAGTWTKSKSINDDNWNIAGCPVNGPRIDALGNELVISWFTAPEGDGIVNVLFSHDGGDTLTKYIRVDTGNTLGRVDVILTGIGEAMVSWLDGDKIAARTVNEKGELGDVIVIAQTSQARSSGFPQMTKVNDDILFAWADDQGKNVKSAIMSLN